jgi:hypothetical protein
MHAFLIVAAFLARASAAPPAQGAAIGELAWMAGCWRQESASRIVDEMWMAPAGGAMLGVSRTVAGGRTVAHEFLQIREDAGRIIFIARPSGQAEASFALLRSGPREVVFENPAHDFPQRVTYRLDGDTLAGRIEGTQNGKPRSVDYPMRRTACPK